MTRSLSFRLQQIIMWSEDCFGHICKGVRERPDILLTSSLCGVSMPAMDVHFFYWCLCVWSMSSGRRVSRARRVLVMCVSPQDQHWTCMVRMFASVSLHFSNSRRLCFTPVYTDEAQRATWPFNRIFSASRPQHDILLPFFGSCMKGNTPRKHEHEFSVLFFAGTQTPTQSRLCYFCMYSTRRVAHIL
jgi:hypothetical protein